MCLFAAFTIVRFLKSDKVEVVPSSWVCDKICFWPVDDRTTRLKEAITHFEQPNASFKKHDVRVIGTASVRLNDRAGKTDYTAIC